MTQRNASPKRGTEQETGMSYQWYPGHMTKTLRQIEEQLRLMRGIKAAFEKLICEKEYEDIHEDSDNLFERGLYRSTYQYFVDHHKK